MNLLWLTLQGAFDDLFAFMLGYVIILLGFAVAGHFIFGSQVRRARGAGRGGLKQRQQGMVVAAVRGR